MMVKQYSSAEGASSKRGMVKWCPAVDISNHDVRTHVQKYRTCFSVKQEKQEDLDKRFQRMRRMI